MNQYLDRAENELKEELTVLLSKFDEYKKMNLSLSMARGKPCKEQLDLSMGMMDVLTSSSDLKCEDGIDARNYGSLTGIPECKRLMADFMDTESKNIIIFGNSSLRVMYDCMAHAYMFGVCGNIPWSKLNKVKWLCPVPGYDRHFSICEFMGIEMINVPLNEDGPDMDLIEDLVSKDESIKGIWCVPLYSNPDGITYSDEVVRRFANLKPLAKDFRIYWDNAYCVHHLYNDKQDHILDILKECELANNPDLVYKFGSTSKVSFPGSGIACLATSENNIKDIQKNIFVQTIGYDKINQLRHVKFFKDLAGVKAQMKKHAEILRPKFELVENILTKEVMDLGLAKFVKPNGGYFISLFTLECKASRVFELCKETGVDLTPVGSSYPYHKDPNDSNLRIAPSFPCLKDLEYASNILSLAIKVASIENRLLK